MSKSKSRGLGRTRKWTFIVYPDSAPADWEEILTNKFHLKWARSPLHDSDLNGDATEKKPHWHVYVFFDGVKDFRQVQEITDSINATIPQKVHSTQGLLRYFVHMDNPEKTQYKIEDIKSVGIEATIEIFSEADYKVHIIQEIICFCASNDIREFSEIMEYSVVNEPEWFKALSLNCGFVVNLYLKSRRYKKQEQEMAQMYGHPPHTS